MDYTARVLNAVNYIESHLTSKITLDAIAREVYISPYHFHKGFLLGTGITVGEYIKRRRLTEAGIKLIETKIPIIDIGMDCCYDSQEAFTRAFKKYFGITPAKYRKRKNHNLYYYREPLNQKEIIHFQNGGVSIIPRIVTLGPIQLTGINGYSSHDDNRIPNIWEEFHSQSGQIYNRVNMSEYYGICIYNPVLYIKDISVDFEFNYFAGVEVRDYEKVSQGLDTYIIPKRKYAVFTHRGNVADVMPTYRYIFSVWLPDTSNEIADHFDFEYFGESFSPMDPDSSELDIYIPIK
ncbi:MAG: AraC family transcriptional regulator [Clostridia bacterium]|nr:AraC family transcriptional regulator [Clostridia bacterium]